MFRVSVKRTEQRKDEQGISGTYWNDMLMAVGMEACMTVRRTAQGLISRRVRFQFPVFTCFHLNFLWGNLRVGHPETPVAGQHETMAMGQAIGSHVVRPLIWSP